MSTGSYLLVLGLLLLAGFFAGGVWTTRKTNVPLAIGLALACALALAAAVLRLV
ncbi:MAG: hypothetical protein ABI181_12140 [Mycobacteriaceae bacterium]